MYIWLYFIIMTTRTYWIARILSYSSIIIALFQMVIFFVFYSYYYVFYIFLIAHLKFNFTIIRFVIIEKEYTFRFHIISFYKIFQNNITFNIIYLSVIIFKYVIKYNILDLYRPELERGRSRTLKHSRLGNSGFSYFEYSKDIVNIFNLMYIFCF